MILVLGTVAPAVNPATLTVAIAAAVISLGSLWVAILSLSRSPQVLWITDLDEISEDYETGPDRSPYIWRMKHSNRGRAVATSVRWRFIDRTGSRSDWSTYRNVAQGKDISVSAGVGASDLSDLSNPLKLKGQGPAYELEWRGARDKKRPHTKLLYPTQKTTVIRD
jgi:hypothetical protein